MKPALAILLLCAACSSGGHSKKPTYPPGYVLDTVAVTDGLVSHYQWTQEGGKTVQEYWLGDGRTNGQSVMEIGPDLCHKNAN